MKLYLGCGPRPFHKQHIEIIGDESEWILVDKFVKGSDIKNWDAETLKEVEKGDVDEIYSSHLLEHFEHSKIRRILERWYEVLKDGGKLMINVPDMEWVAKKILTYDDWAETPLYYNQMVGEHGIMSVIYGSQSHEGEYHKSGFTKRYLDNLLTSIGFSDIKIEQVFEAHDMGVLIAKAKK
jgi:predicted SAM-dependent methyltransferase